MATPNSIRQHIAEMNRRHGVEIHLCRLHGKRWAYEIGENPSPSDCLFMRKMAIGADWGAIVHSASPLDDELADRIATELPNLLQFVEKNTP